MLSSRGPEIGFVRPKSRDSWRRVSGLEPGAVGRSKPSRRPHAKRRLGGSLALPRVLPSQIRARRTRRVPNGPKLGSFGAVGRRTIWSAISCFFGGCVGRSRRGDWVRSAKIAQFSTRHVHQIEKERGGGLGPSEIRRRLSDDSRRRGETLPLHRISGRAVGFSRIWKFSSGNFAGRGDEGPGSRRRGTIRLGNGPGAWSAVEPGETLSRHGSPSCSLRDA